MKIIFKIILAVYFVSYFAAVSYSQTIRTAVQLRRAYEMEGYKDKYIYEKTETILLSLLATDSMNIRINYELIALYHNTGREYLKKANNPDLQQNQKDSLLKICKGYEAIAMPFVLRYNALMQLSKNIKDTIK